MNRLEKSKDEYQDKTACSDIDFSKNNISDSISMIKFEMDDDLLNFSFSQFIVYLIKTLFIR